MGVGFSLCQGRGTTVLLLSFVLSACGGSGGDVSRSTGAATEAGPASEAPPTPATTAVGSPLGDVTSVTVGPEGGAVGTPDDEVTVSIPAGALTDATDIGIQPITSEVPGGLGNAYRLTPDGLKFSQPVKLTFSYSGVDLGGTPAAALGVATQTAANTWALLADAVIDEDAETVAVTTTHFTDFSLLEGFQIRPPSTMVHVGNKAVLNVRNCFDPNGPTEDESGDVLGGFVYQCDIQSTDLDATPLLATPNVMAWYVDGIQGGNGTVGSIAGNGRGSATYTAPATAPDPSTVAVSAELAWEKGGKLLVTASVEITNELTYKGSVHYTATGEGQSVTLTGDDVLWTDVAPTGTSSLKTFKASGMVDATITLEDCNPFRGAVHVEGTLDFHVPGEGLYSFDMGTPSADATLSCNGVAVPYGTQFTSPLCDPPKLGDGEVLKGSGSCLDGMTLEWNFKRIE